MSRRRFLAASAIAAGATVVGAGDPSRAAVAPLLEAARARHGDLRDLKHVVVVMQENRSFDHYFGTLAGVRGFGDRSTMTLPGGSSVFEQPTFAADGTVTGSQFPWHLSDAPSSAYPAANQPPTALTGALGAIGTPHSWDSQHNSWQGGLMDGWLAKKGLLTLGYLDRSDIPFHYALADAYTVGDAYHCSVLSATGPNRTFLWSGTINAQQSRGHVTAYDGGDELGKRLGWQTYAETLQTAGVSWRVYQCLDHFDDNALEYFASFAALDTAQGGTATPGNALYDNGVVTVPEPLTGPTANADNLIAAMTSDVMNGALPQVSWVVANQVFSEHPDGSPDNGAYLVSGILNALNADPDVLNSTLVVINYDENDGGFDHVPPPVASPGTVDEYYQEPAGPGTLGSTNPVPIGLGFRVPLFLISPWTRGGWVTSEVSDHTSIIQLLEKWTTAIGKPAVCPNISQWRRKVCGDLTRAFDFTSPVFGLPGLPPSTTAADDPANGYVPVPATNAMPTQETGTKPARPLPYQPNANLDTISFAGDGSVTAHLSLSNNGPLVAKSSHFAIYDNADPNASYAYYPANAPSQHTVDPVQSSATKVVKTTVDISNPTVAGQYDLTVLGPNRFMRHFTGSTLSSGAIAQVQAEYYPRGLKRAPKLALSLINNGLEPVTFTVELTNYASGSQLFQVAPNAHAVHTIDPLSTSQGWYDVMVTVDGDSSWSRHYVGHLENGSPSITGT